MVSSRAAFARTVLRAEPEAPAPRTGQGGGAVGTSFSTRRPLAAALAAVAVALLLALGAVQPAHAEGKVRGTWDSCAWLIDGDTLKIAPGDGGCSPGSAEMAPWNRTDGDRADMTGVTKIVFESGGPTEDYPDGKWKATRFNADSAKGLFSGLDKIESIDMTHVDTVHVTDMSGMFSGCSSLTSLTLPASNPNPTDPGDYGEFSVPNLDTSHVTSMADMFSDCSKLASIDLSGFDTSLVSNMSGMFNGCANLVDLDVSTFDTSLVTSMASLFNGCKALKELDVSTFETSLVADMSGMFAGCEALEKLDVSTFDTSRVTNMTSLFDGCTALASLDVSKFETSLVTDMSSMFSGCKAFGSLDVAGFDTSQVTNMASMFSGCEVLAALDLSGFTTSGSDMFDGCKALSAVRVGEAFAFMGTGLPASGPQNVGGTGLASTGQWVDPQGAAHAPAALNPADQGAGWYLAEPQTPEAYALFDWGVRGTPPTFVKATENKVLDPGPMAGGRTPKGWVDAAGNPVTFPATVANGSAAALSATWDRQPFSIENYDVSSLDAITYDGKAHGVTVTPKDASAGAVTKVSYKSNGAVSTASPKDAGTYEVLIDVAASAGYEGATGVSLGSFTINKIKLDSVSGSKLRVLLPTIYEGTTETTNTPIKITGGNVVPAEDPLNATAATVTYPRGGEFGITSSNDATVSDIQIENPNYEPLASISDQSYNVLPKKYPALEDFTISLPGDAPGHVVEYNGKPQPAVIEPKQGIEGMGTVTVEYSKNGGAATTDVPKDAGTYKVSFTVAKGVAYLKGTFDNVGTFTITPRTLNSEVRASLDNVKAGSDSSPVANTSIDLAGGNVAEEFIGATATVERPSTAAAGTYENAVVTDIVLDDPTNYIVPDGYELIDQKYTVERKVPTAGDFQNDMPKTAIVYDGQSHPVTVTAKDPAMGTVTVFYAKDKGDPDRAAPKDAGEYEVTFKVEQSDVYEAGSFSLGTLVIKPIALDTTVTALLPDVYEGVGTVEGTPITLTGGPILEASLDATATVTHPSSGLGAGAYQDATVSAIELTSPNYTTDGLVLEDRAYTVLAKGTPKPSDFHIGPVADLEYDGQEHPVAVTAKDPDMGAATVKYVKDGGDATTVVPKDAGTYQVLVDVADSTKFWGAEGLDGGTFTIEKRELNGDEAASGLGTIRDAMSAQNVSVVLTGGNIVPGEQVATTASEVKFLSADVLGSHEDGEVTLAPLPADSNYMLAGDSLTLTGQSYSVSEKPVPTVDQFVVAPVTAEYDGEGHGASAAPKDGVGAAVNLRYLKGATPIEGAPVDAGTYAVMFDVEEGAGYSAAEGLVAQGAVTITPRVLDEKSIAQLAAVPQRTLAASNVAVTLSGGRILGGEIQATASSVSYPSASAVGAFHDAVVELVLLADAPNYALPADGLVLTGQAYTVTAEPYPVLEGQNGSWKQGSGEGLSVRVDADVDKHRETYVDDKLVDPSNYTVESGSTIVTLAPAYLATLAPGAHTLRLVFEDGVAETAFTVAEASSSGSGGDTGAGGGSGGGSGSGSGSGGSDASALAPTGDVVAPFAFAAAALAALAGAALLAARRARR